MLMAPELSPIQPTGVITAELDSGAAGWVTTMEYCPKQLLESVMVTV